VDTVVTQVFLLKGREWTNCYRVTFDEGCIARIVWEPLDIDTFDTLIDS
jgi:hypothetical protein